MITTAMFVLSMTSAQPTPAAAKAVFDHYYGGKSELIVVESFLCKQIEKKKGDTHNDCVEMAGATGAKGDKVDVYLYFLLGKDQEKDIMIQSVHNGVVRSTKDVKVKSFAPRSRTWRSFTLSKKGKWEFKVLGDGGKELTKLSIDAT